MQFTVRIWEIKIEFHDNTCAFKKGWYEFVEEVSLCAGDVLIQYTPTVDKSNVKVTIFNHKDVVLEEQSGNNSTIFILFSY